MPAGEISDRFPLAKPTLSGHFNVLISAGLIVSEKHTQSVVYGLNLSAVEDAMAAVMDLLEVGGSARNRNNRRDQS